MKPYSEETSVIDAGARYGMHPSWWDFKGPMRYVAFEPDQEEADLLAKNNQRPDYEVHAVALSDAVEERDLYLTKHRGICSFLKPDYTGFWFRDFNPEAGVIESVIRVNTTTIDLFAKERDLAVDFLKVDTEGTEFYVIKGADEQLREHALGVRTGVYFNPCYKGQPLFGDIQDFLMERGFFLLNIDYHGYGFPRNNLFRKPDPMMPENHRYGVLISSDGVWLKHLDLVVERFQADKRALALAMLKYAWFCLLNNAPDMAVEVVERHVTEHGDFPADVREGDLYKSLRRAMAAFMGRWRVCPDAMWREVRESYQKLFGIELQGGSGYWQQIRSL